MLRFFAQADQIDEAAGEITLTGLDVNHIKNVLRLRAGDELWISDGAAKEYHCQLKEADRERAVLTILYAQIPDYELPCPITLFQGIPKSDKMETIIQKAVELGAVRIVPVAMKRCVAKMDPGREKKKISRWEQISVAAAKQSRRIRVPDITPPMNFKQALMLARSQDVLLMPYEFAAGMERTRSVLSSIEPGQSIGILIGPEGGFDPEEAQLAEKAGAELITLGKRILRTETAGSAILSMLVYELEGR